MNFKLVSDEQAEERLNTCKKCPLVSEVFGLGLVCGKFGQRTDKTCGCIVKAKIAFQSQKCPSNKWNV